MKEKIRLFAQSFYARFKYNLLFAVLFVALTLLPDRLFELINPQLDYSFDPAFVFAVFVFGFVISLCGRVIASVVLTAFAVMQYIQLNHIAYFGRPINPVDIPKIAYEFSDVWEAGLGAWRDVWFVGPTILISFGFLIYCIFKFRKVFGFSWFAVLVLVIALGVKPERAFRKSLKHFLPATSRYSIHNSLNTFSFFLVKGWNTKTVQDILPDKFYQPYSVEKIQNADTPDIVVLIMGESMSSAYMSLFGYDPETTPFLDSLKKSPDFFYKVAVAGGVSTHTAIPVFFNILNEPGNLTQMRSETTNLFNLAKQAGYKTYWLSAQDAKNTNDLGTGFIDELITKEESPLTFAEEHEDYLVRLFKQSDLSEGKHFVVLHFRSLHDPYETNYEHHPEFDVFKDAEKHRNTRLKNTYRNAMLYTDDVIRRLFEEYSRKTENKKAAFILTSDHGQLLGENGIYGHNTLDRKVAEVPFVLHTSVKTGKEELNKPFLSHYEAGIYLARLFGFKVINPNKEKDVFYIHGNNFYEETYYLGFKRDENGKGTITFKGTLQEFVKKRKRKK